MPQWLGHFLVWVGASKYILIGAAAIFEGPLTMLASGFLFRLGQLQFFPMYLALILGDLVGDIGWYLVGYFGARTVVKRYGTWLGITPEIIAKLEHRFHRHHHKLLFISKLTMGFGLALPMLVVAGMLKVPLKNFILLNLAGGLIWTAFLLSIGYFFGNVYLLVPPSFKIVFIVAVVTAMVFLIRRVKTYLLTLED